MSFHGSSLSLHGSIVSLHDSIVSLHGSSLDLHSYQCPTLFHFEAVQIRLGADYVPDLAFNLTQIRIRLLKIIRIQSLADFDN